MDENLFSNIVLYSESKKREALAYPNRRYLYNTISAAPKHYFVGISGLRGIGKSVMLAQLAAQFQSSLLIAADATYLKAESLYGICRYAKGKGYSSLFLDEVHTKQDWQADIKTLYDEGGLRVFFTGSSALELRKGADLSRRALIYNLNPISFREYLIFKKGAQELPAISASELFEPKQRKERILKTSSFAPLMEEYYKSGGPLYPSEDISYFSKSMESTLERIVRVDLAYLREVDARLEHSVYLLLQKLALSPAGEASYSSLSSILSISKPTLIRVVDDLVRIGLVMRVLPCGKAAVRKEPKLYLAFPFRHFLASSVGQVPDTGALREEFFVSHAQGLCYLKGSRGQKTADFSYAGKILEVGGKSKNFSQSPDFAVKDGISMNEREIPLYLCGFLY